MDNANGCVDIWIDEIVAYLKETATGELKETVVFKIESRSYLKGFNQHEGWHENWAKFPKDVEVYALALKEDNSIQGLVGIRNDKEAGAAHVFWACAAPHNDISDKKIRTVPKYSGVGGHLFAIAADKSVKWGYGGAMYGVASCAKVLNHYIDTFGADSVPIIHVYQFVIDEKNAAKLLEVYNYEWNDT